MSAAGDSQTSANDKAISLPMPAGGVDLSPDRLAHLAPARAGFYTQLRAMDEIVLGETEPATTFAAPRQGK